MDTTRIRQFVDGELAGAEAAAFEREMAADAALARAVDFERKLKDRIGCCMGSAADACCPPAVAHAVRCCCGASDESIAASVDDSIDLEVPAPLRLFRGPARANVFAVAASLAIVAGAVLFGIFGPSIGQFTFVGSSQDTENMAITANSALREHNRCRASMDELVKKTHYADEASIHANLDARLGHPVPVFDLRAAGFELVGGGECGLAPVPDATVHLAYARPPESTAPESNFVQPISIFMQPDRGQFGELEDVRERGHMYRSADFGACQGHAISIFSDGQIAYILMACKAADQEAVEGLIVEQLVTGR